MNQKERPWEYCRSRYDNLLSYIKLTHRKEAYPYLDPQIYIRNFLQTAVCDTCLNLETERQELEEFLGAETVHRIMSHQTTAEDEKLAKLAVSRHLICHQDRLLQGVSWRQWCRYYLPI